MVLPNMTEKKSVPLVNPIKSAIIKKSKHAMVDEKREKAGASLPIFPLPIVLLVLSFSPHPSLSSTQTGLCGGDRNTSKDYNVTRTPKN